MQFKLRQMEIFRAVMIGGSVSAAAQMLHVSQPAVSRALSFTEQKLGLRLFQRSSNRLVPTAAAKRLLGEVDRVYQSALKVNELATELAITSKSSIRLLSSPCVSDNVLPRAITRFASTNPAVTVRYGTVMPANIAIEVLSHRCDVAVSELPVNHPDLQSTRLCSGRMVCIGAPDHPLMQGASVSLEQLAAVPYISYITDSPIGLAVAREFENRGLLFRPAISLERSNDAWPMVHAGGWPALLAEFVSWTSRSLPLAIRPLADRINVELWVVTSKDVPLSVQSQVFIEDLKQSLHDVHSDADL